MPDVKSLDPADIFAELKAQPPLTREEAARAYVDQEVDWMLTFADGSEDNSGRAHLIFRIPKQMLRIVESIVSLSDYPWLKSLRADAPVRVRGRIRAIGVLFIELEISDLSLVSDTSQGGKSV